MAARNVALVSYVLDALALSFGPLVLVQPLIVSELAFALPISLRWRGVKMGPREWLGVTAIAMGLTIGLASAAPRAGRASAPVAEWMVALGVAASLTVLVVAVGRRMSGSAGSSLYAVAAGIVIGTQASLLKATITPFEHGLSKALEGWELWATLVTAVLGLLLVQGDVRSSVQIDDGRRFLQELPTREGEPTPLSTRVSPSEQLHSEIDDLFGESDEERQLGDTLEGVARLGARLLLQSALEAEVTEFLCGSSYERRAAGGGRRAAGGGRRAAGKDARAGSRNGYSDLTVKTTAGPVTLKRPKLRGTTEQFASRLLGKGVTKTNALESLVIAGFIRGLSVRDVEAALAEALGPEATASKSTVSRVCQAICDEFGAFRRRDLSDVELEQLFVDGSHFKYHQGAKAEPVLVA
ncbi:MAG: DMT family transporter [Actinomycetota bacterium]|nr:DMT family transporter [Actinomycetota bacterium]